MVRVWDVEKEKKIWEGAHGGTIVGLVGGTADVCLSAGTDAVVRLWDARAGAVVAVLTDGHQGGVNAVGGKAQLTSVVSGGGEGDVCLWDVRKTQVVDKWSTGRSVWSVDMVEGGARIVAGGDAGLTVWHAENKRTSMEEWEEGVRITGCAMSADGQRVAAVGSDGNCCVYELEPIKWKSLVSGGGERTAEIEKCFLAFMNEGKDFKPSAVARAINMDFRMRNVRKIVQVYMGHVCVRTIMARGDKFKEQDLGGRKDVSSFLFERLYHKLSELAVSESSNDFAIRILEDATEAGLLSPGCMNSILGDKMTNAYTRDMISELRTVMNQVYDDVQSLVASLETRMNHLAENVAELRSDVDQIDSKMKKDAKVQRYANLAKLGLALIPIFGSVAMAVVDGSTQLLMSLDLESLIELSTDITSCGGQAVIDDRLASVDDRQSSDKSRQKDRQAIQLLKHVTSKPFMERMNQSDSRTFARGLEGAYGGSLEELRSDLQSFEAEFENDKAISNGTNFENVSECPYTIQDKDTVVGISDVDLSKTFRTFARDKRKISHRKACEVLYEICTGTDSRNGGKEDKVLQSKISETVLSEITHDMHSLVDEESFVRAGLALVPEEHSTSIYQWGKDFETASDGEDTINVSVAALLFSNVQKISVPKDRIKNVLLDASDGNSWINKKQFLYAAKQIESQSESR